MAESAPFVLRRSAFYYHVLISTCGMKHLKTTLPYDVLVDTPSSEKTKLMTWQQEKRYTYRATLKRYGGVIMPISADWGCE